MKLTFEQLIDADRDRVWSTFDNPENMTKWQPTLESFTPKSGIPGQVDSVSELVYQENGRKIVMTETITERRAPAFMAGVYENRWGKTLIVNHFDVVDENTTRWVSWCNFRFTGAMRFLSLFLAGSIRKRTVADMGRFKLLVETERANEDSR
jgi:uncharacterized protein YndB with AHSA1/START domain